MLPIPFGFQNGPGGPTLIKPEGYGKVFYVDSNGGGSTTSGGLNFDAAFTTLDAAIGACTANKNDLIIVAAAHAETGSSSAQELFDLDVAGVTVIGLGQGDKRPTFTLTHATATVVMGAAGCRLSNIRVIGNVSDLVSGLEIENAADGCIVDHCYFADSGTTLDMLIPVYVAADADRLLFEHNHIVGVTGGEATEAVSFIGGCDGLIFRNNYIFGDFKGAGGAVSLAGAASLGIMVHDNFIVNQDAGVGLCMDLHASTTGGVFRNFVAGSKNNQETITGGEAAFFGENYGNDAVATSGIKTPSTLTAWT